MIFIINSNVVFNEKESTLERVNDTSSKVSLLKPTGRLLSLFVRNNNQLISREQLLNDVWEDYGLKASNNNLNNYISGLRKSLSQIGEEDILITYPRQGFKFMAQTIKREDITMSDTASDINAPPDITPVVNNKPGCRWPWRPLAWGILIVLAALTAGLIYKNRAQGSMTLSGEYKRCQIYAIKDNQTPVDDIKEMIYHAHYNCNIKANIYYYGEMKENSQATNSSLMAYCPLDTRKPCENRYINQ